MKKIKILFCFLILSIIGLYSCSDFLEPEPRGQYTEMIAWDSPQNAQYYLNGFYKVLYEYGPYGSKYCRVSMSDGFSDIFKYNSSGMDEFGGDVNKVVFNGQISPALNPLSDYSTEYDRIRRTNEFLYGLKNYAKFDAATKLTMEAQARFFRAYLHFMLMRGHGSIIIRDNLDGPKEASKPRSSAEECWNFISQELDFAAENLPEKWPDSEKGKLTKGGVYAFKSRAMLYAERWQAAADAAGQVIAKEGILYNLASEYKDAFKDDNINDPNLESVLEFRFGGQIGHMFNRWYTPPGDDTKGLSIKSLGVPTQEIVDSYKMADGSNFDWNNPQHAANPYLNREPRFYVSILYNGARWKGRTIETFVGGKDGYKDFASELIPNTTTTGYYIRKLLDENHTDLEVINTIDWPEIRYAEVLLNHAEALNELGKSQDALTSLNKIRRRAKLPEITTTDQSQLREIIREERKVELAFEGHRYWDLRRWRKSMEVLNGKKMHGIRITKNANGTFNYQVVECDNRPRYFEERYYQFPIPLSEIQNNTLCRQIENW